MSSLLAGSHPRNHTDVSESGANDSQVPTPRRQRQRVQSAIVGQTTNDVVVVAVAVLSPLPTNDVTNWLYVAAHAGNRAACLANTPIDGANALNHRNILVDEEQTHDELQHFA